MNPARDRRRARRRRADHWYADHCGADHCRADRHLTGGHGGAREDGRFDGGSPTC